MSDSLSHTQRVGNSSADTARNGDFYAFLRHDASGTLAVLINRLGVLDGSDAGDIGYGDDGLTDVTFDDASANDVHFYQGVQNPNGGARSGNYRGTRGRADFGNR